ncbi:MAG: hypothetical protein Q4B56_07665 [Erysipelotrichaceae bacterium]|nr:hypothetical protein [Erysipelotrichaceae bacterium]
MGETMDIQEYLTAGVENIMKNAVKVTLTNPAQSIFMARFAMPGQFIPVQIQNLWNSFPQRSGIISLKRQKRWESVLFKMLKKSRNLIPIFSIEGKEKQTDARRGEGVYGKVFSAMEKLQSFNLCGIRANVTGTKESGTR